MQLPGQALLRQLVPSYSYPFFTGYSAAIPALLPATDARVLLLLLVHLQPFYSIVAASDRCDSTAAVAGSASSLLQYYSAAASDRC